MKPIRDEFDLLPVIRKLEHSSEYLKDVEKLIDSKAKELYNLEQEALQDLAPGEEFYGAAPPEYYEKIEAVFPNLLRRSLFMYIYSVLEDGLNNCCRLLNFRRIPLEAVKDKGIRRARRYLIDARVKFPDEKWEELIHYQTLRNCITHSQGRLKGCDHEEDIRKFALSNPHLISLTHTDDEGKDIEGLSEFIEVVFHKGFCEEVIHTINNFLEQLRINMEYRHRNEDF
jgi:hypothetical protein